MTVFGLVRSFSKLAFGLVLTASAVACHPPERMQVGGRSVDPTTYAAATDTVKGEFLAMTACPKAQQSVAILGVDKEEVTELGVSGCNQKRAYLRLKEKESGWGNVRAWSTKWTLKTKGTGEPADF